MGVLLILEFHLRNNSLGHSGDKASAGNVEMEGALAIVYHSMRLRVPIVARLQGDGLPFFLCYLGLGLRSSFRVLGALQCRSTSPSVGDEGSRRKFLKEILHRSSAWA